MMIEKYIILAVCWMAYGAIHSLLADTRIKKWLSGHMGSQRRYYRLFYNIFALLTLAILLHYQLSIPAVAMWAQHPVIWISGILVCISGLTLMTISIKKYFFNLSGLYQEDMDDSPPALCIDGIHRYVRHPLYLGTFAFIWGLWIMYPFWTFAVMNACITLYTLVGIRLEEKKLLAIYGASYRQYQMSVPMIVPWGRNKKRSG